MARQISGVVSWIDNPIYPGKTPVSWKHFEQLATNINLIKVDLEYHKLLDTYEAHRAVSMTHPGFITPEIVNEIDLISDRIEDLKDKALKRLPSGVIILYDGKPSTPPENWVWCNGENSTPDTRGRYVLGGNTNNTYLLHSYTDGYTDLNEVLNTSAEVMAHSHNFWNCWICRSGTDNGKDYRAPLGVGVECSSLDWDNSVVYFYDYFDYTGGNANFSMSQLLPKTVKVPYIMRKYDDEGYCKITVTQPSEGGRILIDGNLTSSKTVKKRSVVNITGTVDEGYVIAGIVVNGETYTPPVWIFMEDDIEVEAIIAVKLVNIKVNQSPFLKTYINGEYTSDTDVRYASAVTITSDSAPGLEVVDYTIDGRGWSGKTKVLNEELLAKIRLSNSDPVPVVSTELTFSDIVEVKTKETKTVVSNVAFELPYDNTYRVKVVTKLFNDFYGYHGSDANVVLEVYVDGTAESTTTFTWADNGELEVEALYASMVLSAGKHLIALRLTATAATATLTSQITGGTLTVSDIGVAG